MIPEDFQRGPWASAEDAKLEINLYCIDPLTGGGGWAVSWHGLDTKYYPCSHWRRIGCANRHDPAGKGLGSRPGRTSNGSRCQWFVKLHKEGNEWTLYNGKTGHNHPLAIESDGQPVRAALRAGIPEQFMILGEQLRHAALPAGTINDILVLNACCSDVDQGRRPRCVSPD